MHKEYSIPLCMMIQNLKNKDEINEIIKKIINIYDELKEKNINQNIINSYTKTEKCKNCILQKKCV
jgi:hypothetical protein